MKTETLISNGVEYPVTLNYYALKLWEEAKGKKMSEILNSMQQNKLESDNIIQMAELCYYGVIDACDDKEIPFNLTEKQFIRGLNISDTKKVTEIVMAFINPIEENKENKRQPNKIKQQLKKLG